MKVSDMTEDERTTLKQLPGTVGTKMMPTGWEWFTKECFLLGIVVGIDIGIVIGVLFPW